MTYLRVLPFIADYLRLRFNVTIKLLNPVLHSLDFTPKPFTVLFLCNHDISILREITSYWTIWRPLLSHITYVFQASFVCDFIWAPFLSYLSKRMFCWSHFMRLISTDSSNWISLPFTSLHVFFFRLIVKGRIIG